MSVKLICSFVGIDCKSARFFVLALAFDFFDLLLSNVPIHRNKGLLKHTNLKGCCPLIGLIYADLRSKMIVIAHFTLASDTSEQSPKAGLDLLVSFFFEVLFFFRNFVKILCETL